MRTYCGIDPRVEPYLLRAEETLAEALDYSAQQALLCDARPRRRRVRVWLGAILLAAGQRLLGSAAAPAGSA